MKNSNQVSSILSVRKNENDYYFTLSGYLPTIESKKEIDEEIVKYVIVWYHGLDDASKWPPIDEHTQKQIDDQILAYSPKGDYASKMSAGLRGMGSYIYEKLFPPEIQKGLRALPLNSQLTFDVDDTLAALPFELVYDGQNFICLRHVSGRINKLEKILNRDKPNESLKLLIIADPAGDLRMHVHSHINYILGQLKGYSQLRIDKFGAEINKKRFLELYSHGGYDIIHYSGHSQSDPNDPRKSCLIFRDSKCYGYEIEEIEPVNPPRLIFSNSCQSAGISAGAQTTGLPSLAGSFLRSGAEACVATLWVVTAFGAGMLASDFYRFIIFGSSIGEALHKARMNSFKRWRYHDCVWASYILYGKPEKRLL